MAKEKHVFHLDQQTVQDLTERFLTIEAMLDSVRILYEERDAITLELQRRGLLAIDLGSGRTLEVRDNFAGSNTVFRPAAVRRFEAIITEPKVKKGA
jgi:hypothetical protein